MKAHLDSFIATFSLNDSQPSSLAKYTTLDGIREESILAESNYLNLTILNELKNNLQTVKSIYLYEYIQNAYSKVSKTPLYFEYHNLFKEDESADNNSSISPNQNQWWNMDIFLLCVSHLNGLVTAKLNSLEQKQVVIAILKVICVLSEEKEIQVVCRRQKFLANFIKLVSDSIVNAPETTQLSPDMNIAILASHVLAKLVNKCKKNQDYLIQKRAYDLFKVVLISGDKNIFIFVAAAGIISSLSNSPDSRLLLWSSGVLEVSKKLLTSSFDSNVILFSYWMISKLSQECKEVAEDLTKDNTFCDGIVQILSSQEIQNIYYQKPEKLAIFGVCLGLIRRIAGFPAFRQSLVKKYNKYPINFLQSNSFIKQDSQNAFVQFFAIRESVALIGVFVIEEESRQILINNFEKLSTMILKVSLNQFSDSKLVKVTLGCLTNLSTSETCRNELSNQSDFYSLIYQSLDKYDSNQYILEYILKMIINNSQNSISFMNLSAPKMILKILFINFAYQNNEVILNLSFKILKSLSQNQLVLLNIVRCYREYELNNPLYKLAKVMINSLKILYQKQIIEGIIDGILLLASFSTVDKAVVQELQETNDFLLVVRDILDSKRSNQIELQRVTSALAYLPLEQLKGFSQL